VYCLRLPLCETRYPLFITFKANARLRGCIGTFTPQELRTGLKEFALKSAFKDSRFPPLLRHELESLSCHVSLLVQFERAAHPYDWVVGVHGISIKFCDEAGNHFSATYLPEVALEQGWDQRKTLKELVYKAGYRHQVTEVLINMIETTRYQSSKSAISYPDYVEAKQRQTKTSTSVPPQSVDSRQKFPKRHQVDDPAPAFPHKHSQHGVHPPAVDEEARGSN